MLSPSRGLWTTILQICGERSRKIRLSRCICGTCGDWGTASMDRNRHSCRRAAAVLCWLLAGSSLLSAQVDSERQLEAAIHREVVAGDLTGAIEKYSAILSQAVAPREVAARALLQIGECHEKLGQRRQAKDAYIRLARDFAGEAAA